MAADDDMTVLRLIRSRRVGPATYHRLVAEHGSARAALQALPEIAAAAGISGYETCPEGVAAAELAAGRKAGARLIRCDSPLYPAALREIDGAPPILWLRGDPAWLSRNPVAVIGARNASSLGLRMARGMAAGLGEAGHTVVAGLARGIDTAAHNAALPTGTVAVMAGGVDVIYPAENVILAAQIAEKGVLVSEQPPGTEPQARHFPTRNRIVSGLSLAVVVIEAAHRSGTLITAKNALDQGREVMAVPGHPMDARAGGCNQLIRDGALLVRNSADVCAALGRIADPAPMAETPTAPRPEPVEAGELEARILSRLGPSPSDENDVIRDLGLPAATANAAILSLELQGRLLRVPGGRLALG
ncbi:DNA-processing protein DprA [uncultured Paracoccus sp.]|uniref:DNA-processing protein DprA n=1 Tax=uncultured Paracoccus sp. TaxID=189685 RepID=UPI0025FFA24D|nr:DNA-processing protein DprA [uncultured Paracoccus sp.]